MGEFDSLLEKRRKQLNNLLKKYKIAFRNVRLDYNVNANTDYSTDRQKYVIEVRNIENQINNVYMDMLKDAGIDESTQTMEVQDETKQLQQVNEKQNRHVDLQHQSKTTSYVKNSAFVRKEITEFRLNREKICLASFSSFFFVFFYVFFRDIKEVDTIIFNQNSKAENTTDN